MFYFELITRYLDQLGMTSTFNHKVYCRQALIGGNYALLNTTTFTPNPDYYGWVYYTPQYKNTCMSNQWVSQINMSLNTERFCGIGWWEAKCSLSLMKGHHICVHMLIVLRKGYVYANSKFIFFFLLLFLVFMQLCFDQLNFPKFLL
jgi:hypothetical protein